MPDPTGFVRVAVVTFNSAGVLGGLMDSLAAACRGLDWELVVADSGSTDDGLTLIAR